MAYAVTEQEQGAQQAALGIEETPRPPSAGELLEASIADADDVGTFAGRDEPAELSYDYAEADRRAVDVLRRVVKSEGGELDPELESLGPVLAEASNGIGRPEDATPPPGRVDRLLKSLARRFRA